MRALALVLLAGCAGSSDVSGTDSEVSDVPVEPGARIGTGELEFEPLEEGDRIDIIHGPQGGYHFLASVRVKGIEAGNPHELSSPSNPTVRFQVYWDDREWVPEATYTQGLDPVDPPVDGFTDEMVGRLAILDITSDAVLDGADVVFEVTVEDVNGLVVTDALTLKAKPHPAN